MRRSEIRPGALYAGRTGRPRRARCFVDVGDWRAGKIARCVIYTGPSGAGKGRDCGLDTFARWALRELPAGESHP